MADGSTESYIDRTGANLRRYLAAGLTIAVEVGMGEKDRSGQPPSMQTPLTRSGQLPQNFATARSSRSAVSFLITRFQPYTRSPRLLF